MVLTKLAKKEIERFWVDCGISMLMQGVQI